MSVQLPSFIHAQILTQEGKGPPHATTYMHGDGDEDQMEYPFENFTPSIRHRMAWEIEKRYLKVTLAKDG